MVAPMNGGLIVQLFKADSFARQDLVAYSGLPNLLETSPGQSTVVKDNDFLLLVLCRRNAKYEGDCAHVPWCYVAAPMDIADEHTIWPEPDLRAYACPVAIFGMPLGDWTPARTWQRFRRGAAPASTT